MTSNLLEIQYKYYTIVKDYLGNYYNDMKKNNLSFYEEFDKIFVGKKSSFTPPVLQAILESFEDEINRLWKNNNNLIINESIKLKGVKAHHFFVPGFEDSYEKKQGKFLDVFSKFGMYADTILIDDPLWRASTAIHEYEIGYRFSRFVMSGFKILQMEDLIFADVDQPIALFIPSDIGKEKDKDIIYDIVDEQRRDFTSSLFQKKFSSDEEMVNFLNKNLKSVKDFFELTKNNYKQYKFFIDGFKDIVKIKTDENSQIIYAFDDDLPLVIDYKMILSDIYLRLSRGLLSYRAQMEYKSMLVDAYPIYEEKVSFEFSNKLQKREYTILNNFLKEKSLNHLIGINILANDDLKWLGNIPMKTLVEMRKNGEMNEFRSYISENLNEYRNAKLENMDCVIKDVKYNIFEAFKQHEKEIQGINSKYKFNSKDFGGLIITGEFAIAGFLIPSFAVIGAFVGGGTIWDIITKWDEKRNQIEELKKRPVNILYDAYHNKKS